MAEVMTKILHDLRVLSGRLEISGWPLGYNTCQEAVQAIELLQRQARAFDCGTAGSRPDGGLCGSEQCTRCKDAAGYQAMLDKMRARAVKVARASAAPDKVHAMAHALQHAATDAQLDASGANIMHDVLLLRIGGSIATMSEAADEITELTNTLAEVNAYRVEGAQAHADTIDERNSLQQQLAAEEAGHAKIVDALESDDITRHQLILKLQVVVNAGNALHQATADHNMHSAAGGCQDNAAERPANPVHGTCEIVAAREAYAAARAALVLA